MAKAVYITKNKIDSNVFRKFRIEASRSLKRANSLIQNAITVTAGGLFYEYIIKTKNLLALSPEHLDRMTAIASITILVLTAANCINAISGQRKLDALVSANRETIRKARAQTLATKQP